MKKKLQRAWAKALRSGEFKQGKNKLQNFGKYCCLGVLCKIADIKITLFQDLLYSSQLKLVGLDDKDQRELAGLNDGEYNDGVCINPALTFEEIALFVENLPTDD